MGLLAATIYGLFVVGMAFPTHEGPSLIRGRSKPLRDALNDLGFNPWHFVFPGRRGLNKRRNFAIRYTGIRMDGTKVVLHEAPEGLTAPAIRWFDHTRTTVTMKVFGLDTLGRVMLVREDDRWLEALEDLRAYGPVRRSVGAFCDSPTLNGGESLASVVLDLFAAGISYETGEQYGRAAHVLEMHCDTGELTTLHGDAEARPDWPGVVWRAIP